MTPKTMRSFAGGLILASLALGITYFASDQTPVSSEEVNLSEEEMQEALQNAGYSVETQEIWDEREQELAEARAIIENEDEETPEETEDNEENQETIYQTIIQVNAGMTSIDVGEMLEATGIVDSAYAFFEEVENRGLSNSLRPQTTGTLTSDMSLGEVVDAFF